MGKKLRITEAQYKRLLNLLVETPFYDMARDNVEAGDIMSINSGGKRLDFKVINNNHGMIQMDAANADPFNIMYRYVVNHNSFSSGDKLEMRRIDKFNPKNKNILDNPLKWEPYVLDNIQGIDVAREGEVVDSLDAQTPQQQQQQQQQEPEPEKPTSDETNPEEKKPEEKVEDPVETEINVDNIYDMILGDEKMQKIFYRQPSFWQTFMAELKKDGKKGKGGRPIGKGLITVLDTLSRINNRRLAEKIGPGFGNSGRVDFQPVETSISINYDPPKDNSGSGGDYVINKTTGLKGPNIIYNTRNQMDAEKTLMKSIPKGTGNKNYKLRILVKGPNPDINGNPDLKMCVIQIVEETSPSKFYLRSHDNDEHALIFLQSPGYNSHTSTKLDTDYELLQKTKKY